MNLTEQENFDDVDLTLEETEAALLEAKKEKVRKQKLEAWNEKINSEPVWYSPSAIDYVRVSLELFFVTVFVKAFGCVPAFIEPSGHFYLPF